MSFHGEHKRAEYSELKKSPIESLNLQLDLDELDVKPLSADELKGVDDIARGDAHGNVLGMIQTMRKLGMIHMDKNNYEKLRKEVQKHDQEMVKYPEKSNKATLEGCVANIKDLLVTITCGVNRGKCMIWLGDVLADRGPNDYFTLLFFKQVKALGVKSKITFSNHDAEFVSRWFRGRPGVSSSASCDNLVALLDLGIIERENVNNLLDDAYFPQLKLINYTLTPEGKMKLYPHAKVPSYLYKALAGKLDVKFDVTTVSTFAESIDRINAAVIERGEFGQNSTLIRIRRGSLCALIMEFVWNDPGKFRGVKQHFLTSDNGIFCPDLDQNIITVHGHVGMSTKDSYTPGHGAFRNHDSDFAKVHSGLSDSTAKKFLEYYNHNQMSPQARLVGNSEYSVEVRKGAVPVSVCQSVPLEQFKKIEAQRNAQSVIKRTEYLKNSVPESKECEIKAFPHSNELLKNCQPRSALLEKQAADRRAMGAGVICNLGLSVGAGYYVGNGTLFSSTALTSVNTLIGTQAVSQVAIGAAVGGLVFSTVAALVGAAYFAYKGEYTKSAGCAGLAVVFGVTAVFAPYVGLGVLALIGLAALIKKACDAYQGAKKVDGYERVSDSAAVNKNQEVAVPGV